MNNAIRVAAGILAITFLLAAIYFGLNQSWSAAIVFFLLFGGLEFAIWSIVKPKKKTE